MAITYNFPSKEKIDELVSFFKDREIPETINVSDCCKIVNVKKYAKFMINCLLDCYKRKSDQLFYVYYDSLKMVKELIEKKLNQ